VPSAVIRRRSGAAALTLLVLAALCATTAFGASKPAAETPAGAATEPEVRTEAGDPAAAPDLTLPPRIGLSPAGAILEPPPAEPSDILRCAVSRASVPSLEE